MSDNPNRQVAVLVVDDDVTALETYRHMLMAEGYVVRVAETAASALADAAANPPDVLLVDLHMPLVDGVGFLKQIRATMRPVPAAILTGDYFLEESLAAEIKSLGARIHFKPLWDDDLIRLVTQLLESRVYSSAQQASGSQHRD